MAIDPNNLAGTATLTFDDEFNTLSLWNGSAGTWATAPWYAPANGTTVTGNQQWYINSNYAPTSSVKPWTASNGVLSITADHANPAIMPFINNYEYTSGSINTYYTFSQTYGYFEMSAQLPKGQGLWPAFWLVPTSGQWPPEIDIMEVLGQDTTEIIPAMHTMSTGTHTSYGYPIVVADLSVGFHTFGLNWAPDYITWYVDGVQIMQVSTPSDLHQPMYMLANLAVGGYWPGPVDDTTPFPASYKIDYIRVYADPDAAPPSAPPPPPPPPPPPTTMTGTGGNDEMYGTVGNDTINGLNGGDLLYGDAGSDIISGGMGNDVLDGERDADTLTGGRGRDTFLFNTEFDRTFDRITDFSHKDDTITLENGVFTALGFTGGLPNSAFYNGAAAHDASDRIIYNPATGVLSYDADGTGPIAPVQFAVLGAGVSGVAANDFYVV